MNGTMPLYAASPLRTQFTSHPPISFRLCLVVGIYTTYSFPFAFEIRGMKVAVSFQAT